MALPLARPSSAPAITLAPPDAGPRAAPQPRELPAWRRPFLWVLLALIVGIAAVPVIVGSAAMREEFFLILMLVIMATSINIIMGYTGYVSFGHVVFFGLGGYTAFFLMMKLQVHFVLAALVGGALAVLFAVVLGSAVLRLRGAYFALATIGVNEATRSVVMNVEPLGGATGMFFNYAIYGQYGGAKMALWLAYYAIVVVALAAVAASYFVRRSKFGLGLMAIREDQDTAQVLGISPARHKVAAFAVSALFPALSGAIFFFKNGVIEPGTAFHLLTSIEGLVMVMLGGVGTISGPIVGAVVYERLRAFLLTNPLFSALHLAIAGVLLLVIVLFVTAGVVGALRQRFALIRAYVE
ncbi:MAG TPA: branched-chain amino acid ABC transporter permease [Chloroflexota bacterium]|nr:branched-chain amino acid ABC transporter permease [Chloroflexota bacterium]